MAGTDRNGQRIDTGLFDKPLGFVGIGQQLIVSQFADSTVAVFLLATARFERSEATEFTFDTDALGMSRLDDFGSDANVVVVVGGGLAIFHQRSVHHHAGETIVDRRLARVGAVAVILVHHDRDVRIEFRGGQHQVTQVGVLRVRAGSARCLNDHWRIRFFSRLHDRLNLFHVVDIECSNAVIVFSSVIKDDAKRNQWHGGNLTG